MFVFSPSQKPSLSHHSFSFVVTAEFRREGRKWLNCNRQYLIDVYILVPGLVSWHYLSLLDQRSGIVLNCKYLWMHLNPLSIFLLLPFIELNLKSQLIKFSFLHTRNDCKRLHRKLRMVLFLVSFPTYKHF